MRGIILIFNRFSWQKNIQKSNEIEIHKIKINLFQRTDYNILYQFKGFLLEVTIV
jgi:hypothetical protein